MEIKKCVRCGNFITSKVDVCTACARKDTADVNKLKVFLVEGVGINTTKSDVAYSTGITMSNLNRYLNLEDFKGYNIPERIEKKASAETLKANVK